MFGRIEQSSLSREVRDREGKIEKKERGKIGMDNQLYIYTINSFQFIIIIIIIIVVVVV